MSGIAAVDTAWEDIVVNIAVADIVEDIAEDIAEEQHCYIQVA